MLWRIDLVRGWAGKLADHAVEHTQKNLQRIDGWTRESGFILPLWMSLATWFWGVWHFLAQPTSSLTLFRDRAIGAAITAGLDPSSRAANLLISTLICLLVTVGIWAINAALATWAPRRLGLLQWRAQRRVLCVPACVLACSLGLLALFAATPYLRAAQLSGAVLMALAAWNVLAMMVGSRPRRSQAIWLCPPWQLCGFALCLVSGHLAAGEAPGIAHLRALQGGVLVLWTLAGLVLEVRWPAVRWELHMNRLVLPAAVLPGLAAVPFVGTEVQYARLPVATSLASLMRQGNGIVGAAALLALALSFWLWPLKAPPTPRQGRRLMTRLAFPALVLVHALFAWYRPQINLELDYLHFGNLLVPIQQLMHFGKLPFVDLWHPRGLYETLPAVLYTAAHGWTDQGSDAVIWTDLVVNAVGASVGYAVAAALFSPLAALLGTLCLGFSIVTGGGPYPFYYAAAAMPALVLPALARQPTWLRWSGLWVLCLLAFAWMPSAASASVPAIIVSLLLAAAVDRRWRDARSVKSFALVMGSVGLVYAALLHLHDRGLSDTLQLVRAFAITDTLIGPYAAIVRDITPLSFLMYGALPAASLALAILLVVRGLQQRRVESGAMVLLFLTVTGLLLLSRALHRHCLVEGLQLQYICLGFMLLPWAALRPRALGALLTFCTTLLLMANAPVGYPQHTETHYLFRPRTWQAGEHRLHLPTERPWQPLKDLLDATLRPEQTFAEVVNAHMLYALTDRPYAFFHHANQILQSDAVQRVYIKEWERKLTHRQVPYVIMHFDGWWGNEIDNISPQLGTYRLVEFIYKHYEPYAKVGGVALWRVKDASGMPAYPLTGSIDQTFELPIKSTVKGHDVVPASSDIWPLQLGVFDPFLFDFVDLDAISVAPEQTYTLQVQYTSTVAGRMQVFMSHTGPDDFNAQDVVDVDVQGDGVSHWTAPVSHRWLRGEDLKGLRIDPPNGAKFTLTGVRAQITGDTRAVPLTQVEDHMRLGELARIWAVYDPQHALEQTPTLQVLLSEEVALQPGASMPLILASGLDKGAGNYLHLRLQSGSAGNMGLQVQAPGATGTAYFAVHPSDAPQDYLVRISGLYAWNKVERPELTVTSEGFTTPVVLHQVRVTQGD